MTEQLTLSLNVCMKSAETVNTKCSHHYQKKTKTVTCEVIDVFIDLIVM